MGFRQMVFANRKITSEAVNDLHLAEATGTALTFAFTWTIDEALVKDYTVWVDNVLVRTITDPTIKYFTFTNMANSTTMPNVKMRFAKKATPTIASEFSNIASGTTQAVSTLSTAGLKAFFNLNETSGTVAIDQTGNHNGTNTGGIVINQPGVKNSCYKFVPTASIEINNHADLQIMTGATINPFAIGGFFKFDSGSNQWLFNKRNLYNANAKNEYLFVYYAGKLHWQAYNTDLTLYSCTAAIPNGLQIDTWYHFFVRVFYNSDQIEFFVNGNKQVRSNINGTIKTPNTFTEKLLIGRDFNAGTADNFDGSADMLGVWKTTVPTDAQISDLYNNGLGVEY